jgi:carbamate kinase
MNSEPIVVALGGNALVRRGEPTDTATQRANETGQTRES